MIFVYFKLPCNISDIHNYRIKASYPIFIQETVLKPGDYFAYAGLTMGTCIVNVILQHVYLQVKIRSRMLRIVTCKERMFVGPIPLIQSIKYRDYWSIIAFIRAKDVGLIYRILDFNLWPFPMLYDLTPLGFYSRYAVYIVL